jgi:hypothetical protein
MAQTSRISAKSDKIIQEMISITGKAKIEIIEEALEVYRHRERMRLFNESYDKLRSDKKAWKKELKEREELEGTLEDGLENEESKSR